MTPGQVQNYRASPGLLKGRVIAVTGAGSGLGQAAALSYAEAGASTVLLGRKRHKLVETSEKIERAGLVTPVIAPMDLLSIAGDDYKHVSRVISEHFGQLDGLLHSAAVLGQLGPISSSDVQTWYNVIQVNLNAAYLLTRELLPLMEQARDASIVFTTSSVGQKGYAYWGAYSVSKFGTEGLAQVLAEELARTSKIRVNCINPGAVNTAMRRQAFPAERPESNPSPDELMGPYLYLMGNDSRKINGQVLCAQ